MAEHEREREREDGGIHVRAIGRGALAILGGIVFAVGGSWWLLRELGPAANTARPPAAIPAPRLQSAPQPERAAYFAGKQQRLDSAGWVDRNAGIAHIPLIDAMRLAAARTQKGAAP
jgi:hypothetical protein